MIPTFYRGSVKDLFGPVRVAGVPALIFEYSDSYSVFDWGKMPDALPKKGESLAALAAVIFEKLEQPEAWKEYSRSSGALALRKGNRFGAQFNELGEVLQSTGLRTHYLGVLENEGPGGTDGSDLMPKRISEMKRPFRRLAVKQVSVVKPAWASVLGRTLPDYSMTRLSSAPRLVPLEVVFRFSCPENSSIRDRIAKDPGYLTSLGFGGFGGFGGGSPEGQVGAEPRWDFPVLELFTKLEPSDRPVPLSEALAITGLTAAQLQEVLLKTAWVAGILKFWFSRAGVDLVDGKLEWAISEEGKSFLVDSIGPDELRLVKNGIHLSKELLRGFYRSTQWYGSLERAKALARSQGIAEWKKFVSDVPSVLPPQVRDLAAQIYLSLAHQLAKDLLGVKWLQEDQDGVWSLNRVVEELERMGGFA